MWLLAFAGARLAVAVSEDDDPLAPWREQVRVSLVAPGDGRHAIHAYYTTCPESPHGKSVIYFASRAPNRPNGLGLSLVRLLALEPGGLRVGGVDAVDGTPVYDVKPYLPWCEAPAGATANWAQAAPPASVPEAIAIPAVFAEKLGPVTTHLVRQLLRLELQPAYHADENRTYGMTVSGWNVRWRAAPNGTPEVFAVDSA